LKKLLQASSINLLAPPLRGDNSSFNLFAILCTVSKITTDHELTAVATDSFFRRQVALNLSVISSPSTELCEQRRHNNGFRDATQLAQTVRNCVSSVEKFALKSLDIIRKWSDVLIRIIPYDEIYAMLKK
jgi:hypothetical protein